jgi:hypothetical protein
MMLLLITRNLLKSRPFYLARVHQRLMCLGALMAFGLTAVDAAPVLTKLSVNGSPVTVGSTMTHQLQPGSIYLTLVAEGNHISNTVTYKTGSITRTVNSKVSTGFEFDTIPHRWFDITLTDTRNSTTTSYTLWVYEALMPGQEAILTTGSPGPTTRMRFGSSVLSDGRVLVTGGQGSSNLATTHIYNPVSNTWAAGPNFQGRSDHSQTTLVDGRVLVSGGIFNSAAIASAQIYDPVTNTWSDSGSLTTARSEHRAALLNDGRVLIVGGKSTTGDSLASAEIFDPATNSWTSAGSMSTPRVKHSATLLHDGRVLVAGGGGASPTASAEVFDPVSGHWSATPSMVKHRAEHMAALLHDGRVLVAGGYTINQTLDDVELFDPETGTWSLGCPMGRQRRWASANVLPSGQVLVIGGYGNADKDNQRYLRMECYDPSTGRWNPSLYSLSGAISPYHDLIFHTSIRLNDGRVMIIDEEPPTAETILISMKPADVQVKVGDLVIPTGGAVDFGTVVIGEEAVRTLTLTNTSTSSISPNTIQPWGFYNGAIQTTLTIDGSGVLLPGESTTATLKFKPTSRTASRGALALKTVWDTAPPSILGARANLISRFEAWAASAPGIPSGFTKAEDAPHGDGVANLLKYAFNLDTDRADARGLAAGGTVGLPKIDLVSGTPAKLRLEYLRRKDSGLTYIPQFGTRLNDFATMTETPVITSIDDTWERAVIEKTITGDTGFARVKVNSP